MNKRRSALILSGILVASLFSPVFSSADEIEKINLRNFEETILITDMDITKGKKEVAIKQVELNRAKDNENTSGDTDIESKKNRGYNVKEATKNLEYQRWLLDEIKEQVVIDGTRNYFNYLLKSDEIELQKSKILRLNKELGQIKTKISLGTAVQSMKVTKELEITKEEFVITKLEFELESLALELNKSLLWDLETTIDVFDMNIPTVTYEVENIEAVVEDVLENHGEMLKLTEELELNEMYLEILYTEDDEDEDDEIIDAKADVADIKLNITNKKMSLEYDVRSSYNNLLNIKDQLTIKGLEIENLEYNHVITQKRYDVGLEVVSKLEAEEEVIEFGYYGLKQAELDYYIQVESFKNMVVFE